MNSEKLIAYFESAPAIRLLRAQNAPFICDFFVAQFKTSSQIAIPHSELQPALAAYQQDIRKNHSQALRDRPEIYLTDWCDRRWLYRYLESGCSEPIYQLTAHTEQVLSFLDRHHSDDLGFIGTNSRLKLVIETLESLVIGTSDDPARHLEHLQQEKARIEREIAAIQNSGQVEPIAPTQAREQFSTAVSLLKQLQSDFRGVEERFRSITNDLQQKQLESDQSRGGLLEHVLDAEDTLRTEDQGVSFYEFFKFIQSPEQQDRLRVLIQELGQVEDLSEQRDSLQTVRRMMPVLLAEASKVTQTERRLSAALRRMLDKQTRRQRVQVAGLLNDIRTLAVSMSDDPPKTEVGVELESSSSLKSAFARTFWSERQQFDDVEVSDHTADADLRDMAFDQFAGLNRLDFKQMRSLVRQATNRHGELTLGELVQKHHVSNGVMELLGYLQIASDDGHEIRPQDSERVSIRSADDSRQLSVTIPHVTYVPNPSRRGKSKTNSRKNGAQRDQEQS